ncbi:hypothetical protein TNCV_4517791 [Trichonephila clavipes]|nr:hypothetical protein TNCV_4517791 [Trichonephila clavipes]
MYSSALSIEIISDGKETTQLVGRNETAQLCTAVDRLQPPATAYNRLQPPTTACNRLQPPATAYNRLQPPATAYSAATHRAACTAFTASRLFPPTKVHASSIFIESFA